MEAIEKKLTDEYALLAESFRRSLLAQNKSPRTVTAYMEATRKFGDFLRENGMPREVSHIKREHVEAWIADLLAKWRPATASNRYRSLAAFFKCLLEGGGLPREKYERKTLVHNMEGRLDDA